MIVLKIIFGIIILIIGLGFCFYTGFIVRSILRWYPDEKSNFYVSIIITTILGFATWWLIGWLFDVTGCGAYYDRTEPFAKGR